MTEKQKLEEALEWLRTQSLSQGEGWHENMLIIFKAASAHLKTLNAGNVVVKPHNMWKPKGAGDRLWAEGYVVERALTPCEGEVEDCDICGMKDCKYKQPPTPPDVLRDIVERLEGERLKPRAFGASDTEIAEVKGHNAAINRAIAIVKELGGV